MPRPGRFRAAMGARHGSRTGHRRQTGLDGREDLSSGCATIAEAGKRLHWFNQAIDADLNALYNGCTALLAVSLDEGFGLPLIEAAKHGLPILARDIPVFREIAGRACRIFLRHRRRRNWPTRTGELDRAVEPRATVPTTAGMPWLTWEQSAQQLLDVVLRRDLGRDYHGSSGFDRKSGAQPKRCRLHGAQNRRLPEEVD